MKFSEHIHIAARSIRTLFSLSKTGFICMIFKSLISAILPYVPICFSARLIDALYTGEPIQVLALYVLLTVGIVFLLKLIITYLSSRLSVAQSEAWRNDLWMFSQKALQLAYESVEDHDVELQRNKIRIESQTGYNIFYLWLYIEEGIHNTTQIIMSLSLTLSFFFIDAITLWMKLAFSIGVILAVLVGILTTNRAEKLQNRFMEQNVDWNILSGRYEAYIKRYNSGKDIRVYDMSNRLLAFIMSVEKKFAENQIKMTIKIISIQLAHTAMNHLLHAGTYILLIYAALSGGISIGQIAQYISCLMLMLTAISGVISNVQIALVNHKYLKHRFSWFDIPNNMYRGSLTVEKRDDNEYFVEFRDVSFRYPNTEAYALRHVNLKFKVGEKLAVVGRNGSGKTTFIKLMCRLYDPTEGEILLNGVNIQKYDYDEYMSIFSVVFQDFQIFAFSIGQNVAARAAYDVSRVKHCLCQAGFGDRLASLPKGTETCLYKDYDKDGIEISGGEAQKIALARALYKDAPFIILDEPTAALDPISEYEIYSRFNEIAGDKTAIYISHRLASCRFCDKIAVFDNGEIVQTGSHDTLLAEENGKYYELWRAQAQYYTASQK